MVDRRSRRRDERKHPYRADLFVTAQTVHKLRGVHKVCAVPDSGHARPSVPPHAEIDAVQNRTRSEMNRVDLA
jgi:hypothetical protein